MPRPPRFHVGTADATALRQPAQTDRERSLHGAGADPVTCRRLSGSGRTTRLGPSTWGFREGLGALSASV